MRIGALTAAVTSESDGWGRRFLLFAAPSLIADPVVLNRGTIGARCVRPTRRCLRPVLGGQGAVGHRGPGGEKGLGHVTSSGDDMTAVGEASLLHRGSPSAAARARAVAHEKFERRAVDWAIAATSAALWLDGGRIADAGIALSAVGMTTIHLSRAEELLRGQAPSEDLFAQAGEIASEDCSPSADGRGPIDYKRHLAGVLTRRALGRSAARATRQEG